MSRYTTRPLEFLRLNTVPLAARGGKVKTEHFGRPFRKGESIVDFLDSLPRLLAADSLRAVVAALLAAREGKRSIIWGIGGHVIKCGLAPILIDMMRRGYATAFAMNGSAAIHDFEIALAGHTSEDVESVLPDGRFGSAEETGRDMNVGLIDGNRFLLGAGESLGKKLQEVGDERFVAQSLLFQAYAARVPVTVHVAVGTDTPHTHPKADAAAIGSATHRDFRLFSALVKDMDEGGVYLNVGSAVVMPEVFLKAVSAVRNLGFPLKNFTTANFDFLQHYRPKANVVERPHANAGGKGYSITGHHEIMIPLLAAMLVECEA